MSPYTSAWSHYIAAAFFKLFGTSLWVYRASGISLVVAGVFLICMALKNLNQARAAAILPWVAAFFSAAVINHRFVIEINTFHVFCFGLFVWGLSSASRWASSLAILSAVVLGVTSHVLFIAPVFACLILAFWDDVFLKDSRKRLIASTGLVLLAGFFLRIHLGVPEKDKSLALLLVAGLCLFGVLFPSPFSKLIRLIRRKIEKPVLALFFLLCAVAGFFLLFFSEGSWAAAFFNGGQSDTRVMIWPLIALGVGFPFSWKKFRTLAQENPIWAKAFAWAALTVILTAVLATKPAPRYFEIPFLILASLFALALAHAPKRWAALALGLWVASGFMQLKMNYFKPALEGNIPERSFHFLFFKDNSSDTLSKQDLARYLADSGCRFDQISSSDVRIMDPLKFLSLGDWRTRGACRLGTQLVVERKSQLSAFPLNSIEISSFVLYTPDRH